MLAFPTPNSYFLIKFPEKRHAAFLYGVSDIAGPCAMFEHTDLHPLYYTLFPEVE
jgi:hypothetical protein